MVTMWLCHHLQLPLFKLSDGQSLAWSWLLSIVNTSSTSKIAHWPSATQLSLHAALFRTAVWRRIQQPLYREALYVRRPTCGSSDPRTDSTHRPDKQADLVVLIPDGLHLPLDVLSVVRTEVCHTPFMQLKR
eukprot:3214638-Amphidinium_carterae.1